MIVKGRAGTPDPVFHDDLTGYRLDGLRPSSGRETGSLYFAGVAGDPTHVELAPGRYTLTAVRGLEHHAEQREVEVPASGSVSVAIASKTLYTHRAKRMNPTRPGPASRSTAPP